METTPQYLKEYQEFLDSYKLGEKSGEEVGHQIARFAHYYAKYNLEMVGLQRLMSKVAADIESSSDDNGKVISSAKAQAKIDSTDEAHAYRTARAHMQNCEQYINALKALQKGSLNEYAYGGN